MIFRVPSQLTGRAQRAISTFVIKNNQNSNIARQSQKCTFSTQLSTTNAASSSGPLTSFVSTWYNLYVLLNLYYKIRIRIRKSNKSKQQNST